MTRYLVALIALAPLCAVGATLSLTPPYGELIDGGAATVYYEATPPDRVDCTMVPSVQRATTANPITIVVRRAPFRVLARPACPIGRRDQSAYRFFGKPGVGRASHVFSVDHRECRIVRDSGAWLYESSPFWASPIDSNGGRLAGGVPVPRIWKPFGGSSQRYTTEAGVVAQMLADGWVSEGVAMCVSG